MPGQFLPPALHALIWAVTLLNLYISSGVVILKKKTIASLLSILMLLTIFLSGCTRSSKGGGNQTYSIPKNGIITRKDLAKIKTSGGLAIYKGSNKGIDYKWTFVGPDIKNPNDVNLKVSFKPSDETAMQKQAGNNKIFAFSLAQKGTLPGKPSLSITVGKKWSYGTYNLYSYDAGITAVGNVHVVNGVASLHLEKNNGGWYFFTKANITATNSSLSQSSSIASSGSSEAPKAGSGNLETSKDNSTSSSKAHSSGNSVTSNANSTSPSKAQSGGGNSSSTPAPVPNPPKPSHTKTIKVTITIRCDTAVANWNNLDENKKDHRVVPADGCILPVTTVNVNQGETVYNLLVKVCESHRIQMEHKGYAVYNSEYIQGINNLYEKNCGPLSGWMYCVNGWYPNYGVSLYVLKEGDAVQFNYTCDLGHDLPGADSAMN